MPATFSRASARVAASLILTIVVIGVVTSLGLAWASGPYNVQSGDTLYSIAGKMGVADGNLNDWVDEVVAINSLASPDALRVGQQLTLPASGAGSPSSATSSSGSARSNASYTVRAGDTLHDVAARNGVSDASLSAWIDSVLRLNNLSSADNIREGEELKLPALPSASGSSSTSAASSATPRTAATSRYTVRPGDTLYDVAARNGVSDASLSAWIDSVLKLNDLSNADSIREGEELKLPAQASSSSSSASPALANAAARAAPTVQYTVREGDTLYGIAIKNGVPEGELSSWIDSVLKLNNLGSPDLLALGDALKVPPKTASASASSGGTSSTSKPAATITYVVKPGDTLYDIGLKNGAGDAAIASWVDTVLALNDLDGPDLLREGASLKLPAPPPGSGGTTNPNQPSDSSLFVSTGNITYNVHTGDTWSGIARKLNVPEGQTASWIDQAVALSHVSKDEKLVEGIVLLVPSPSSASSPSPSADLKKPASEPSRSRATTEYTVQSGDTLSEIAGKFKIGFGGLSGWLRDVLELNRLGSADMLIVGQTIVVPGELPPANAPASAGPASAAPSSNATQSGVTGRASTSTPSLPPSSAPAGVIRGPNSTCFYTVLAGDTWDGIAQKLGVAADSKAAWIDGIRALNNVSGNTLPVGDALRMLC